MCVQGSGEGHEMVGGNRCRTARPVCEEEGGAETKGMLGFWLGHRGGGVGLVLRASLGLPFPV